MANSPNAFLPEPISGEPELSAAPVFDPVNSKNNFQRTLSGTFNDTETKAALTSGDELAWKKRYTTSFHMSEQLGIPAAEIGNNFERYHNLFFEHDDINKSYGSLLTEQGKIDEIEPVSVGGEVAKSVARGSGSLLLGGTAGIAALTGFAEEAGMIQQFNRRFQENFEADPKVLREAAKTRGSYKQLLNPAWLMTGGAELLPNLALFAGGAGIAIRGSQLILGTKLLSRLSPTFKTIIGGVAVGETLTIGESLVEAGSVIGSIQDGEQRKITERTLKYIDGLSDDQRNSIAGKALIKASEQFNATKADTVSTEIASNAASEVFARNLVVNSIFNAISFGAGAVSGRLLFKAIQGKAVKTAGASGVTAAIAALGEAEQELRQNNISSVAIVEALTGNAVKLDMLGIQSIEALLGDDAEKFDTALAAIIMSGRSGAVQILSDIYSSKSYHEAEVKVNKVIAELRKNKADPEVRSVLEKIDDAPLLQDKIGILKDRVKTDHEQLITDFQKDRDFAATVSDQIAELAEVQGISVEEATSKFETVDITDEKQAAEELSAEPEPTTQATVQEIQEGIDKIDFGDIKVTPVQSIEDIPNLDKAIFSKVKKGAEGVFIDRNGGEIYLIADSLASRRIKEVALHERFHAGLRKSQKDVSKLMSQVFDGLSEGDIAKFSDKYDLDLSTREGRNETAEEFLARVAQDDQVDPNLFQRIVSAVKQFFRNLGANITFTDNDILAIIARSTKAVIKGGKDAKSRTKGQPTQAKDKASAEAKKAEVRFSLSPSQRQREKRIIAELIRLKKIEKDPAKRRAEGERLVKRKRAAAKEELQALPFEFGFSPEVMAAGGNDIFENIKQVTLAPFKAKAVPPIAEVSEQDQKPLVGDDTVNVTAQVEERKIEPVTDQKIEKIIKNTKTAVLSEMKKTKNISFENKQPFITAYKNTMIRALQKANHELVYTRSREIILKKIRNIEGAKTEKTIDTRVADIVQDINRSRQRDDSKKLMAKVDRILGARLIWSRDSRTEPLTKKKMTPAAKRHLKLVKNVYRRNQEHTNKQLKLVEAFLDKPMSESEPKELETFFNELKDSAPGLKDSFYKDMPLQQVALTYFNVLTQYGSLQKRTPLQIGAAIESIQGEIDGGMQQIEELRLKQQRSDGERIATFVTGIEPRGDFVFKKKGKIDQLVTSPLIFDHRLNDMIRHGTTEAQEKAEILINQMSLERTQADTLEDTEKREAFEELEKVLEKLYKKDARIARNELEKTQEKFRKYSKEKQPRQLSKMNLMQIYVSGVQDDLKAGFRKAERDGQYFKDLTNELSEADFALIKWAMNWHDEARSGLSKVNLRVTGLPVISPAYNYMPVTRKQLKENLRETHTSTSVMVKRYTERVQNDKDIQENVSMLNLWAETVRDNAHFKARAEINLELSRIFGSNSLQEEIAGVHDDQYLTQFMEHITDVVAGGYPAASKIDFLDDIRAAVTLTTLALNGSSMFKQASSMVTMGLEIGIKDTLKHFSTVATKEGMDAIRLIVESDQRKNRFASGFDEGTKNAIAQLDDVMLFRWLQKGMITISAGDIFPSLIIGQGIYRDYFKQNAAQGMSPEAAKNKALDQLFLIVNKTQTSSKIENQPLWIRQWGTAGRFLGQFKSSVAELLSHEVVAIRKLIDNHPDKRNEAINALLILHVLMPISLSAAGMLFQKILGEEIDSEEEKKKIILSIAIGPWSGLILAGTITEAIVQAALLGEEPFWKTILPAEKAKKVGGTAGMLLYHLVTMDIEEALNDFNKLATSFIPFWQQMRQGYENHFE